MKTIKKWSFLFVSMAVMILAAGGKARALDRYFVDTFIYEESDGDRWRCAEYGEEEAGVWGCYVQNPNRTLTIPTQVRDENGKMRKVTSVIGQQEATNGAFWPVDETFSYEAINPDYELVRLVLPDTVNYIGEKAFRAKTSEEDDSENPAYVESMMHLSEVVFPQNPELVIGEKAFEGCTNLSKLTFRADVGVPQPVQIEERAFAECPKLTEVTFPRKVTMEADALADCENLKKIVNAPEEIDMGSGKSVLSEVYFAEGLTEIGGISYYKKVYLEGGSYYMGSASLPNLTKVVLPSTVQKIRWTAFQGHTNLSSVNLPNGLKEIGASAFEGCTSLTGITAFPATLTDIGDRAFMGCKNLRLAVHYPEADLDCGYDFKDSGITSISFSKNLLSIFPGSLSGCKDLKEIRVEEGNRNFSSKDGVLYADIVDNAGNDIGEKSLFRYPPGKSWEGSYTIPSDVAGLGGLAFESCKFKEIHIPVTVKHHFYEMMASLNDTNRYHCFDKMVYDPKIYVVRHSYMDFWRPCTYELGPAVEIRYQLDGGKNHASNKASILGGEKLTLYAPSRSGYEFLGWKAEGKDDYVKTYELSDQELIDGVTFRAYWKKKDSGTSSGIKAPGKVGSLKLINAQTTSFKASYSKVSGADGYQILVASNSKFTAGKKTVKAKGSAATVKGLKSGKTYYVKVRAYKKDGQKTLYGKYSPVKKIKTISVGKIKKLTVKNPSKRKLTFTASSVKGAKGYQFLLSTDKSFKKNRKVVTTKKRTAAITKLSKGKTYYVKARAYKFNAQKQKVYGAYTKTVKIKVKK